MLPERSTSSQRLRRAEVVEFFRDQDSCLRRHGGMCDGASLDVQTDCLGHEVKLVLPAYVNAHVQRNKND
jgi:hypothetical protein